jgi:hypothetical protein
MSNKTFDYGDLRITMTADYGWVWDDTGTGARRSVCLWTPTSQGNLSPLGDYAEPRGYFEINGNKRASLLVGQNPNTRPSKSAVARPTDYTRIWIDNGSGGKHDGAVWRPVAPTGYVALGDVGCYGYGKPSLTKMWCVREDLVGYGKFLATSAWDDGGSGATQSVSMWAVQTDTVGVDGSANIPVMADTFRAQSNYSRPGGEAARVLLLPVGKDYKQFDTHIPTVQANNLPIKGQQFSNQEQCKVTLPFHCYFSPTHQPSLDNIRNPFLTITRSIAWYVEGVWGNATPSAVNKSSTVKYGVTNTKSEEMTHSVGVEITASYGVELASASVSLNYQFTYNTSSSFTEYTEKEDTQAFEVDPYYAKVLFSKHVWIKCSRLDSPVILHQIEMAANDDTYFTGCDLPRPPPTAA